MVTEINRDVDGEIHHNQNGSDEDYNCVIRNLRNDKLKLLKEQKTLYLLLADKEEQILKMSEIYKSKWKSVCEQLRYIERICTDAQGSGERLPDLKLAASELMNSISSPKNMDTSFSSYFTVTDTADSTYSSSSESIIAKNNDTITKATYFQSLNNIVNDNNRMTLEEDDYNHLKAVDHGHRSHSDCFKENGDFPVRRSGIETDTSESLFRDPDDFVRRSKKLTKKTSSKVEKLTEKFDVKSTAVTKPILEFTNQEVFNWLQNVVRLPKILLDDLRMKNKINGKSLEEVTEQKFEKLFGTSDKLIKKKVLLVIEEYKADKITLDPDDLASKDHLWVSNVWLKKHLGLSHLCASFLSRCIDGRLLKWIAQNNHSRIKELLNMSTTNYESSSVVSATPLSTGNRTIYEPSKSDLRSLRFGLMLLIKFEYNLNELDKRRAACEDLNKDVLVWTNERFAKWFQSLNLKNYIRGIEYSGIHGGMMVLDSQFSVTTISKLIQMPSEVAKKNNLEDKISILLKPSRFNEGIKSRRSTSIFRRRSLSQPRYSKTVPNRPSNATPDVSDSASNNDSTTMTLQRTRHKDKSHTVDLSHSPSSKNHNFVRTYRKPDGTTPKISVTDIDPSDNLASPNQRHYAKSPPAKLSAFPFQIVRRIKSKSDSGSENEEDFEI